MKKPWWVKITFDDFCSHFFAKNDNEIIKDIRESVKALLEKNPEGECFGAKMVRSASRRIAEKSEIYRQNVNARWHPEDSGRNGQKDPSIADIYDFCSEHGLDDADARDFFEMNFVERGGKDRNGIVINNWQGALVRFCASKARKRNRNGKAKETA